MKTQTYYPPEFEFEMTAEQELAEAEFMGIEINYLIMFRSKLRELFMQKKQTNNLQLTTNVINICKIYIRKDENYLETTYEKIMKAVGICTARENLIGIIKENLSFLK